MSQLKNYTQLTFTCSKSTIETLEKSMKYVRSRSGVFIVNFVHIFTPFSNVSIVNFEQVNVSWVMILAWNCISIWTWEEKYDDFKKIDYDIIVENYNVIFLIYSRLGAIRKPHFHNSYFFINKNLWANKNLKRNWEIFNTVFILSLWWNVQVLPKNADISKI